MDSTRIIMCTVIGALLLCTANDLIIRRYRPSVWNGRGDCPIDDPFGAGMRTLNQAIIHARHIDDSATLQRIYAFMIRHVREHYHFRSGLFDVDGKVVDLQDPERSFDRRWDDTTRAVANGDVWASVRVWFAHDECTIRFDSVGGDHSWRFSLIAKYPQADL